MATKAFDPSKFRTTLTKSIQGMSAGFNDPTDWVSTGNYALNYLISGEFNKGVPLGKVTVFAENQVLVNLIFVLVTLLNTHKIKASL